MPTKSSPLLQWIRSAKLSIAATLAIVLGLGGRLLIYHIETSKIPSPVEPLLKELLCDICDALLTTGIIGIVFEALVRRESETLLLEKLGEEVGRMVPQMEFEQRLIRAVKSTDRHYKEYSAILTLKPAPKPHNSAFHLLHIELDYTIVFRKTGRIDDPVFVLTSSMDVHQNAMLSKSIDFSWLCRILPKEPGGESLFRIGSYKINGAPVSIGHPTSVARPGGERTLEYRARVPKLWRKNVQEYRVQMEAAVPVDLKRDFLFYSIEFCAERCYFEFDWSAIGDIDDVVSIPMIGAPNLEVKNIETREEDRRVMITVEEVAVPHTGLTLVWKKKSAVPNPAGAVPQPFP